MSSENSSQEKGQDINEKLQELGRDNKKLSLQLQDINEKLQELERDSKKLPLQVLDIKEKLQELERDGKKSLFQVPGIEEKELELERDSKKLLQVVEDMRKAAQELGMQFRHLKAESRVQDEMLNEVINSMLSRGLAKNCIRFVSGDKKNISSEITLIPNEKSNPQIPIVLINLDGSTTPLEKMLAKY